MKNSLFKRAVAVAASLPLALTQCLTYANAVTNDAVQGTAKAVQAEGAEDITIESLLKIDADKTISEWNVNVSAALTEAGAKSGSIDLAPYVDQLVEKAGVYGPALKAALDKYVVPNGATYEIKDNHDIILKAKLSQPDFNGNYKNTFGGLLADIGKKYGAPGLDYIDFSSVNVAGDLTITVKASQLDGGTEVPVTFEYKTANGTYGLAEIPAIVEAKAKQLKAIGEAEIAKQVPAAQADAAKAEFDKNADKIIDKIQTAEKYFKDVLDKFSNGYVGTADNAAGVIAKANSWLSLKGYDKFVKIPETATKIATTDIVANAYAKALAAADTKGRIKITNEQIGAAADSVTDIMYQLSKGQGIFSGRLEDAEKADVKAWVEEQGNVFVDSFKKITAKVKFDDKLANGSVDLQIERVLVTNTTTTTTSTSTTTSTTTDTTTSTSTDTTTSTSTDTTTSTSTDTTTTTSTDTTTSTSTTTFPPLTTSVVKSYVEVKSVSAFYMNTEEEFDKAQIKEVIEHTVYVEDVIKNDKLDKIEGETVKDIRADVDFGQATPSNTYKKGTDKFEYQLPVYTKGTALKDADGEPVVVTAYIGVKGDVNLDSEANAVDASQALHYYAELSSNGQTPKDVQLSGSSLVTSPEDMYDQFAAFLGDVCQLSGEKVSRFATKDERVINAVDASDILAFYARRSSSD